MKDKQKRYCHPKCKTKYEWEHQVKLILHDLQLFLQILSSSINYCSKEHLKTTHTHIEQEVPKELMILQPYTVAYPRTVVVHPHYALITHRTMVSSWRLYLIAFMAKLKFWEISCYKRVLISSISNHLRELSVRLSYSHSHLITWKWLVMQQWYFSTNNHLIPLSTFIHNLLFCLGQL